MNFDINQINHLIQNRRSTWPVQYDTTKRIDDSIIEQLLENANWAPNHKHTEPWRFTVFTGKGLKQFANWQSELYKTVCPKADFEEKKYNKLKTKPLLASHIIAIGMKRHANLLPEIEEIIAVSCAVQNMYLTAAAYNIGCYLTTGGVTYYNEAKAFLNLNEEDKLLGFLYLGVIKTQTPKGKRKPITDKVKWVS